MEDNSHKIAVSGASGFVGSALQKSFQEKGWDIVSLGRKDFTLEPGNLAERLQEVDTVVNLAGAPVINRWTEEYKRTIYESRINVTRKLVDALSHMERKPALFISTSAVGYYASEGTHTEEHNVQADDFLGRLTRDWEDEALKARGHCVRMVIFRLGIVLGKGGGALKQMLNPFKMGLGGTIGDGSQGFSWIHMADLIRAFEAVIEDSSFEGTYNLTAPGHTTNKGLTSALGKALHRPALLHIPEFVLRLQFGEGAQMLTKGQRVVPKRLLDSGFVFSFPDINEAVKDCVSG